MDDNSIVVIYGGNSIVNMTIFIKRFEMNYFNYEVLDNVEWFWFIIVVIFVLFGMIGVFVFGVWVDYFGRFVKFFFCFYLICREVIWYVRFVMVFVNLCLVFGLIFFLGRGEWFLLFLLCLWRLFLEEFLRWYGFSRFLLFIAFWSGFIVVCFIGFKF